MTASASVPTGSANVSTQVIQVADITVSVQLGLIIITQTFIIDQTAHYDELGVPTSVSTLAIHDMASVVCAEEHDPFVSHIQLCFSALINDKQDQNFQSVPTSLATGDQVTPPADITVSVQLGLIIIAQTLLLIRLPIINLESPLIMNNCTLYENLI